MNKGSIRLRLWSAAAISIVVALAIGGVGLTYLFERHVERRVESELTLELNQLIGATALTAGAFVVSPAPTDPRFAVPLSGYYWQVEDMSTGTLTRSRSLWDEALALPRADAGDGSLHLREIPGPAKTSLIAVDRVIVDPSGRAPLAATAREGFLPSPTCAGSSAHELCAKSSVRSLATCALTRSTAYFADPTSDKESGS